MNGIKVGSRLEQLLDLRKRVNTELVMLGHQTTPAAALGVVDDDPSDPKVLVPLSHVDRGQIRVWSGGDPSRRGQVPLSVVDAYATAHRPWTTPRPPTRTETP